MKGYQKHYRREGGKIVAYFEKDPAAAAEPKGDPFLQSREWRTVRMRVLKAHGARCRACGATPADGAVMNVDHIKPRWTHPELALTESNLQVLCNACNHGKGSWDDTDWRGIGVCPIATGTPAGNTLDHILRLKNSLARTRIACGDYGRHVVDYCEHALSAMRVATEIVVARASEIEGPR